MAPAMKLTYFPFSGRAGPIRHTLYIGGIDFEDERLDTEAFKARKEAGALPFQSFPVLTVDDEVYAESGAILRYAGKLAGLYPKCDKAAMKVDMIVDALETVVLQIFKDSSQAGRENFVKETVPRYIGAIDKIYSKQKGPYLLGDQISIADIKLFPIVTGVNGGARFDHIPAGCLDKYAHVMAAVKAVGEHPKVKEWDAMHK